MQRHIPTGELMRVQRCFTCFNWIGRAVLILIVALAVADTAGVSRADEVNRPVAIRLTFERPVDGSMAPFVLAASHNIYGAEGVAVTTSIAKGTSDAIARVASGESDLAVADINELIRFRDDPTKPAIKAVFMLFNQAPYAIIARKSRGIHGLADLEGKTLGVAEGDLSIRLWPALARESHLKAPAVKIERIGAAVREPILSAGQVDAVSGFSYLSAINLRDRGVPAADLAVLKFSDYGCQAYGLAVIANPGFAASKPQAVKAFLRALIGGLHLTMKDPAAAAAEVASRMDDGSRDLELERLKTVLADNILTPEVRRSGLGGIDPSRMERAIDQLAEERKFRRRPSVADIFDDGFLPPVDDRLIN